MKIQILGTESLGVRGLCCSVELADRKILIDPGIALGWKRYGLLPHPFQVAVGAQTRDVIIVALKNATDVVFSHFDGDHIPLANANPYQMNLFEIQDLFARIRIWAKDAVPSSDLEKRRRSDIEKAIGRDLPHVQKNSEGPLYFSSPVPHGLRNRETVSVMMTRISENGETFVHASDVQLLHEETVDMILDWHPKIVLTSGPPLYLSTLSAERREISKNNALKLARNVETLLVDHHLLRSEGGISWLEEIASASGARVTSAAGFMGREPLLLEAWRQDLYEWFPVPINWHKQYKNGEVGCQEFLVQGMEILRNKGKINRIRV